MWLFDALGWVNVDEYELGRGHTEYAQHIDEVADIILRTVNLFDGATHAQLADVLGQRELRWGWRPVLDLLVNRGLLNVSRERRLNIAGRRQIQLVYRETRSN